MLKFISKTIMTVTKFCAFCVFVNELAYLDHEVREFRRKIDKLKTAAKG